MMAKIDRAFLLHDYEALSMSTLAKLCGFSRGALYQYFRSKEEAFRYSTRQVNVIAIEGAFPNGERMRRDGCSAACPVINVRVFAQPGPEAEIHRCTIWLALI